MTVLRASGRDEAEWRDWDRADDAPIRSGQVAGQVCIPHLEHSGSFPTAALTSYHKLGGFKRQVYSSSADLRPVTGHQHGHPCEVSGEESFGPRASGSCRRFLALEASLQSLPLWPWLSSLCIVNVPDTQSPLRSPVRLRAHPSPVRPHANRVHLQKTLFLNKVTFTVSGWL